MQVTMNGTCFEITKGRIKKARETHANYSLAGMSRNDLSYWIILLLLHG
jgi:hypothetical protein